MRSVLSWTVTRLAVIFWVGVFLVAIGFIFVWMVTKDNLEE